MATTLVLLFIYINRNTSQKISFDSVVVVVSSFALFWFSQSILSVSLWQSLLTGLVAEAFQTGSSCTQSARGTIQSELWILRSLPVHQMPGKNNNKSCYLLGMCTCLRTPNKHCDLLNVPCWRQLFCVCHVVHEHFISRWYCKQGCQTHAPETSTYNQEVKSPPWITIYLDVFDQSIVRVHCSNLYAYSPYMVTSVAL